MSSPQTTTPTAIEARVVPVVLGLLPTHPVARTRWTHYRGLATPARTRRFRVDWTAGTPVPSGFFTPAAQETWATMSIVTDYSVTLEHVGEMVIDDHHQLERAIYMDLVRGDPCLLVTIESTGAPQVLASEAQGELVQVSHDYMVSYMRDWRG